MKVRRSTALTPEGWYYVFVTMFIVGGAVLREINLLVLMAGLMIGPLILQWRFVRSAVARLRLERHVPTRVHAGEIMTVTLTAGTRGRRAARMLRVEDTVRRSDQRRGAVKVQGTALFPIVPLGRPATATYDLVLGQRGRYRFGPLRATTRYPLGLLRAKCVVAAQDTVVAWPQLGELSIRWQQAIAAERVGSRRSDNRQGWTEGDYYGLREWRAGDSTRWIHWRTSARLGNLAVRQFEQQRNRDVAILLDLWRPAHAGDAERGHVELAVSFAATALAQLGRRSNCRLAFAVAGAANHLWSGPASSRLANEALDVLAEIEPSNDPDVRPALAEFERLGKRAAGLVAISTRGPSTITTAMGSSLRWLWINVADDQVAGYFRIG